MEPLPIIKPDGSKQRTDVTLTAAIASAMVAKVLAGQTLYPEDGVMRLTVMEGNTEIVEEVSVNTYTGWLRRDTVIPGENRLLRSALEEARVERKRLEREARQVNMIEIAEQGLAEVVRIPITHGKRTTRRFRANDETGEMEERGYTETQTEGADPELVAAKVRGISFALERLEPIRYGARLSTENKHVVFSLPEIRRAEEQLAEEAFLKQQ